MDTTTINYQGSKQQKYHVNNKDVILEKSELKQQLIKHKKMH